MMPTIRHLDTALGPIVCDVVGEGPPVLLLHGWGGSARHWLSGMAALRRHYTLYAPDLPGFGASPPLSGTASIARIAEAVIGLADALSLERFALVGHSLGSAVASLLAARQPERVTQLALTSFGLARSQLERGLLGKFYNELLPWLGLWRPWLGLWQPWLTATRPLALAQWSTPPLPQLIARSYVYRLPKSTATLQAGVADLLRMDARTALESSISVGDPAVEEAVRAIQAPTMVISGRQDRLFPLASVQALAHAVPGARLALLDHCGHIPMVEQPIAFFNLLKGFLAS